ncbi:MAG: hypothetical protein ACTSXD_07100 [Candidatus Heimdallarchaeaceae archaeon]
MIQKIMNKLKKKKLNIQIGKCGIIEPTSYNLESGIDNKYTRNIVIYSYIKVVNNKIIYGKILDEKPYTEEEVKNLIKIKKIPILPRRINNNVEIVDGKPFGEIIT